MDAHRLRAPSEDGALLAVPSLSTAGSLASSNARRLGAWDHDFQGRRAGRLRPLARRQALEAARGYLARFGLEMPPAPEPGAPWIVTGHQAELYHPGVWVKNFATAGMARAQGGLGLNLIVDNDLAKSTWIRVPRADESGLHVDRVDFDLWSADAPVEDLDVVDESRFASFAQRVRAALPRSVADPLVEEFWPLVLNRRDQTKRLGLRFASARRQLEASWGCHNAEVPLSTLCETEAFLWFASHLLAHLPRFQEVHNQALAYYRSRYGIRSRNHPVPALTRHDDWLEAPFWVWRSTEPRRRPLFVRQRARSMQLRAGGEDQPWLEVPLGPDREACCAVEQLLALPAQGIRLRTRALTTTMFARTLLGDLFVHGIGGAKYDELGDAILRRFFHIEPPDYLTLSMTLWLGLDADPATAATQAHAARMLRELAYNPDRHLPTPAPAEAQPWLLAKRQALAAPVANGPQRLERFRQIRRANQRLQPWVQHAREYWTHEHARMVDGMKHNLTVRNREFSFVLHSESRLREVLTAVWKEAAGA